MNTDHEQSLTNIAYDLFNEMFTICRKAARYGMSSTKIRLSELPTHAWIAPYSLEHVKVRLMRLIQSEQLLKSYSGDLYELSWEKAQDRVPILCARDLIEAGYPINEEKYGIILRELKRAILEGHIPGQTIQAELLWVKRAFPQ
jgi:hypothetical protein